MPLSFPPVKERGFRGLSHSERQKKVGIVYTAFPCEILSVPPFEKGGGGRDFVGRFSGGDERPSHAYFLESLIIT
jgi:hypothetical protein